MNYIECEYCNNDRHWKQFETYNDPEYGVSKICYNCIQITKCGSCHKVMNFKLQKFTCENCSILKGETNV